MVVAPLDRREQRLLPRHRGLAAARQQPEPVVEPGADFLHRKHFHAGCGQLDSQRNAVQSSADLGHGITAVVSQREFGNQQSCPLDEEAHRLAGIQCSGVKFRSRRWKQQRTNSDCALTGNT